MKKVLVAEDEESIREFIVINLTRSGYIVEQAENGAVALEKFKENEQSFDVAVLDEPSSALDPIAESEMYENLNRVTKDKTVVYISHRLSSAAMADRIIVLDNGNIIESGTHTDLMANGGMYSEMFTLQASNYNKEAIENE